MCVQVTNTSNIFNSFLKAVKILQLIITNYSGIALSSLLSKIFDNCIISNQYDSLFTNDLQFAYKSKTSTIHWVSSIFETANYYVQ